MLKTWHIDCLPRSWIISNFRLFLIFILDNSLFLTAAKNNFLGWNCCLQQIQITFGWTWSSDIRHGMNIASKNIQCSWHGFFNYQKQRKKFKTIYDQLWNTKPFIITSESVKLHWSIHCCREEFNKFLLFWYYLPCYNRTHLYTPPIQSTIECHTR